VSGVSFSDATFMTEVLIIDRLV
jgi:TetR/AcrR family transcriptional repressor of lmrAB and yxaGH operons